MARLAWALVLLAAAAAPAALAGGSYGHYPQGGCHGYPVHDHCSWYWSDYSSCKGRCTYGGEAVAHCHGGRWNVTQACPSAPTGCKTEDLSFKYVSKWTCKDGTCYAYCDEGCKGVVKAICSGSTWHYYGECIKVEQPKICYGKPSAYGAYFPDDCEGKDYVKGYCIKGCEGSVYAKCHHGKWVVYGECKKVEVHHCPKYCSGTPSLPYAYFPKDCYGKKYVEGYCADGYEGEVYAKCKCGHWVTYGECKKVVEVPRCPTTCEGKPPAVYGIYWPNSCKGQSYVKATCNTHTCQPGHVEAKCECGKWVVYGSCQKVTVEAPKCYGTPKIKKYGKKWSKKRCHGKHSCATKCSLGCSGKGYTAKCVNGKWKVTGTCYRKKYIFWGATKEHY